MVIPGCQPLTPPHFENNMLSLKHLRSQPLSNIYSYSLLEVEFYGHPLMSTPPTHFGNKKKPVETIFILGDCGKTGPVVIPKGRPYPLISEIVC